MTKHESQELNVAALRAELARLELRLRAQGRKPELDDEYIGILIELERARHVPITRQLQSSVGHA